MKRTIKLCVLCFAILISGILGYMIGKAPVKTSVSSTAVDAPQESGPALKLSVVEDP